MKRKIQSVLNEVISYVVVVTEDNKYLIEGEALKILTKNPPSVEAVSPPQQGAYQNKNEDK